MLCFVCILKNIGYMCHVSVWYVLPCFIGTVWPYVQLHCLTSFWLSEQSWKATTDKYYFPHIIEWSWGSGPTSEWITVQQWPDFLSPCSAPVSLALWYLQAFSLCPSSLAKWKVNFLSWGTVIGCLQHRTLRGAPEAWVTESCLPVCDLVEESIRLRRQEKGKTCVSSFVGEVLVKTLWMNLQEQ